MCVNWWHKGCFEIVWTRSFFLTIGVESESETSSENSEAHDSPITDHWNAANESQNSQDDSRDPSLVPPPEFIFSEETKRRYGSW